MTKTQFAYRVDRWDARGDTILDHIGGLDDLEVATAAYEAACKRWPREPASLRQGARVIKDRVFRHACKLGLEGIVSKRKGSPYRSGRSPDWLKMKNPGAPAVKREAEEDWGR